MTALLPRLDEALARIQQQIEQLNVDLQRLRDDAQRAMNLMAEEAQVRINDVLIPAVERLATAELQEGDEAYDFTSAIYDFSDGTEKATGEHFQLAEVAREKPVALIFGSYT